MAKSFSREITKAFKDVENDMKFATVVALTRTAKATQQALSEETKRVFDRPTPWIVNGFYIVPASKKQTKVSARVGIKDDKTHGTTASEILEPHIEGGPRHIKKAEFHLRSKGILASNEFIVPAKGVKLDQYGNVRGPYMVQLLSALQSFTIAGYDANVTQASIERRKRSKSKKIRKDVRWMTNVFTIKTGTASHLKPGIYLRSGKGKNSKIKPLFIFVKGTQYKKRFKFFETVDKVYREQFQSELDKAVTQYVK